MTDNEFILRVLERGPATTSEILNESFAERGEGCMVHSRVADLRKQGYAIRCDRIGTRRGRGVYQYRLLREPEQLQLGA